MRSRFSWLWPSPPSEVAPPLLGLLLVQVLSMVPFAALSLSLVLFLTDVAGWTFDEASSLTACFIGLNFCLHWLCGWLGGRFVPFHHVLVMALVTQTLGSLSLSLWGQHGMAWTLAITVVGSGFLVTSINGLISEWYRGVSVHRETAFFLNYSAMNLGFLVAAWVSGYVQMTHHFNLLWWVCSGLSGVATVGVLCGCARLPAPPVALAPPEVVTLSRLEAWWFKRSVASPLWQPAVLAVAAAVMVVVGGFALQRAALTNALVLLMGGSLLVSMWTMAVRQERRFWRDRLMVFCLLTFVALVYWTMYQTTPVLVMYLLAHAVTLNLGGLHLAPQWFEMVNNAAVVLGGPLLVWAFRWLRRNERAVQLPQKFALGLGCMGVGFLAVFATVWSLPPGTLLPAGVMVGLMVAMSLAELLIAPIGLAMIASLLPQVWQGRAVGGWLFLVGLASVLANQLTHVALLGTDVTNADQLLDGVSTIFLSLGGVGVLCAATLWMASPMLVAIGHVGPPKPSPSG